MSVFLPSAVYSPSHPEKYKALVAGPLVDGSGPALDGAALKLRALSGQLRSNRPPTLQEATERFNTALKEINASIIQFEGSQAMASFHPLIRAVDRFVTNNRMDGVRIRQAGRGLSQICETSKRRHEGQN